MRLRELYPAPDRFPTAPEISVPFEAKEEPKPNVSPAAGLAPHQLENRRQRRSATATWQPPKAETHPFWCDVPWDVIGALRVGGVGKSGDGENVRVLAVDRDGLRAQFETVTEELPTRRELLEQRQRRASGRLDPQLNRLRREALRKASK